MLIVNGLAGPANADWWNRGPSSSGVPEIDPGSMASAVALVVGGIFMMTDRFFRK